MISRVRIFAIGKQGFCFTGISDHNQFGAFLKFPKNFIRFDHPPIRQGAVIPLTRSRRQGPCGIFSFCFFCQKRPFSFFLKNKSKTAWPAVLTGKALIVRSCSDNDFALFDRNQIDRKGWFNSAYDDVEDQIMDAFQCVFPA